MLISWHDVPVKCLELIDKYRIPAERLLKNASKNAKFVELDTEIGKLRVKTAGGVLSSLGNMHTNLQKLIGGPTPLTSALVSGALAWPIGYGVGKLLELLYFSDAVPGVPERTAKVFSIGASLLPLLFHGIPNIKEFGLEGLFKAAPLQLSESFSKLEDATNIKQSNFSRFKWKLDNLIKATNIKPVITHIEKSAAEAIMLNNNRSIFVPEWADLVADDPHLSLAERALATALPAVAAHASRSNWISPSDVARVAINAGIGGFIGNALGRLAGAVVGLPDDYRLRLRDAGILAGAIKAII